MKYFGMPMGMWLLFAGSFRDKLSEVFGYDAGTAADVIRKAKPTIYTLVRKGLLPAYKKGKKLYFYEDELLAWIENGRRKSAEQTYEEMLANMQGGVRHKPKSSMKL